MAALRYLLVQFDTLLRTHELPAFRGAIVAKVGREYDLFHNHQPDGSYHYRYPLIQYKILGRKPAIVCLGEGVEHIHHLFGQRNWDIQIGERNVPMRVARLELREYTLRIHERMLEYRIGQWLPLNQDAYHEYRALSGLVEQTQYLERKLTNHILAFAKGLEWQIDYPIDARINALDWVRPIAFKDQKLMGFDLQFSTNAFLPNFVGLGGKVSHGFGMVVAHRDEKISQRPQRTTPKHH